MPVFVYNYKLYEKLPIIFLTILLLSCILSKIQQGDNMNTQQIAKTILEQIKATTPTPVLWSWGASKWQMLGESTDMRRSIKGLEHSYLGGLMFYVRGHHHKGHVVITLGLDDLYVVSIGHVRKGEMKPKKQIEGVYFDMLGEVIDELVERKDEYQF